MKRRHGFVSNSSSASFVVPTSALTDLQIMLILNHVSVSDLLRRGDEYPVVHDDWLIENDGRNITGATSMDNFDMYKFMSEIGINMELVKWSD